MNGPVAWEQLLAFAGILFTVVGSVLTLAWFMWQRIAEVRSKCFTEVNAVSKELQEFKIRVAERYVKYETLSEVDNRVGQAIAELKKDFGDRLDKRFDDMKDLLLASAPPRKPREPH